MRSEDFSGSRARHRVSGSFLETLMTRLSMLPGDGSRHGGPVERRQKMRAGSGCRCDTRPPLPDTENEAEFLPLDD